MVRVAVPPVVNLDYLFGQEDPINLSHPTHPVTPSLRRTHPNSNTIRTTWWWFSVPERSDPDHMDAIKAYSSGTSVHFRYKHELPVQA